MTTTKFDRDRLASWYARQHLKTDPGIVEVHYLPNGSPDREIRFLEVNSLVGERDIVQLEPVDFGVDFGTPNQHSLLVVDVTPSQMERVRDGQIHLPDGWTLEGSVRSGRRA